ncbi:MAG: Rad52/Rad22 family DNA repair protein, partial [Polyangiaceae bacterium]
MKKEVLTKPFRPDQIKQRKGHHGRLLSYVSTADVIARLNECFDFQWSFEVLAHSVEHGEAVVLGRLTAGGVTKCAFGGAAITVDREGDPLSNADSYKAACADCLKKASSLFGIGLDLYGGSGEKEPERQQSDRLARRPQPLIPTERVTSRQLAALHSA